MKAVTGVRIGIVLPAALMSLFIISCEKQDLDREMMSGQGMQNPDLALNTSVVYFTETFMIVSSREALVASRSLADRNFLNFDNFMITVQNGTSGKTKVTRMELTLGNRSVTFKDFKKNASSVTMPVTGMTASSVLNIKLEGSAGRFVVVTVTATPKVSSVSDIDGNDYRTVRIGDQWWMAENLKTTRFNDGTSIPAVEGNQEWLNTAADHLPAFSWYENNSAYKSTYGALYNWAAAGNDKLCPTGWRLPESSDIYELSLYIDPESQYGYYSAIAGGALKEKGTEHWNSPNEGATDKYAFTALPGGNRNVEGAFVNLGTAGSWWSDNGLASYNMSSDNAGLSFSEGGNEYGRSVRCVKE
ncbi:MAG TPA: fibrobacter succinogenes major paralogous domain-containing protein [Bacteroidales bacterium]|nr:fibrobacter succinogenes major paralogous domain-containing protein [Bacteroidales bacterium]